MKHIQSFLQWGTLALLCCYSILVLVRINLGRVFLPFHDGFVLVLAILIGVLWICWPYSGQRRRKDSPTEFSLLGLLILQGLLLVQIINIPSEIIYLSMILLALLLMSSGVLSQEKELPSNISSYLDRVPISSVPTRMLLFVTIAALTWIPWLILMVGIFRLPINWVVVWATTICSVSLGIFVYGFVSPRSQSPQITSFWQALPVWLRYSAHGVAMLTTVLIIGAFFSINYPFSTPLAKSSEITLRSMGWQEDDQGFSFDHETVTSPDAELVFDLMPTESGEFQVVIDGYLSNLGGQIELSVTSTDGSAMDEVMKPLQCELWVDDMGLTNHVMENRCPRVWVQMKSQPMVLEKGREYTLTLTPGDEIRTGFNQDLQILQGGYIHIRKPELEKL